VANTNTFAYLDGNADVAGNINVTAKETRSPVDVRKAYIIPSTANGVLVDARQGNNSTGDVLDDLKASTPGFIFGALNGGNTGGKNTGFDPLANWFKSKLGLSTDVPATKDRAALQGAVAVAVAVETNNTTARIGNGDATHSKVNAFGAINVNSTINNRPKLTTQSSAKGAGSATDVKGLTKVQGTAQVGISLAWRRPLYHPCRCHDFRQRDRQRQERHLGQRGNRQSDRPAQAVGRQSGVAVPG
jgi:hypothetical protein